MLQIQLDDRLSELYDFFQNAPIGVHVVDPEGMIRFANGADLELAGFADNPDGYIGHHIAEFHSEQAVIDDMLERLLGGRPLIEQRATLLRSDGDTTPVVIYSSPRFEDGRFLHTRCFTFPDTATRPYASAPKSQDVFAALTAMTPQERDELFEVLDDVFENAPVALHIVGPDGHVRRANLLELKSMGYDDDPSAYIGHHIAEFHAEQPVIEEMLERLVGGRPLVNYPAVLKRRDGGRTPVLIYSSPRFEAGEFVNTRCFTFERPADATAPARSFGWPRNDDDDYPIHETDPRTTALRRLAGRKATEESLGFLAETSKALAATRDYAEAAGSVCELSVPFLADWCAIELDTDGEPRVLGVARGDGVTGSDELVRASTTGDGSRTGASEALQAEFATPDGAHGALLLVRAADRPAFGVADVAVAEEVARRVGAAVESGLLREQLAG
jgi:PAS domain S-box-containing protein